MDRWLFTNGKIYSLAEEGTFFDSMLVENGKIVNIYENLPSQHGVPAKKVIDLHGDSVIPSFTDSHFHFMPTVGLYEYALNVSEYVDGKIVPDNIFDVGEKLKRYAAGKKKDSPILCFNYIIKAVKEDRLPNREEIDSWLGSDRFVMFISMDGHSSSYSTEALKYMGMYTPEHDGILSGADHEFNLDKLSDFVFKHLNISTLVHGISHLINDLLSRGITSIHALDGLSENKDLSLLLLYHVGGLFPIQFYLHPQIMNFEFIETLRKRMKYPRAGGCGFWEMDGSVGSQTAAFDLPYLTDSSNTGKLYYSQEKIDAEIQRYHDSGYQVISHAIGTRAIERILSAFEKLDLSAPHNLDYMENRRQELRTWSEKYGFTNLDKNSHRHRIEHFEFPIKEQVDRVINNGILVSAQPGYAYFDERFQKSYQNYIPEAVFNRQIPLRTIAEQGGVILGSSDSPVQYHDPFIQIAGMVKFPIQNERLSMFQALRTYTLNPAVATFEEDMKGTLEPEKLANFMVLNKDPFTIKDDEIEMLHAKKVYTCGKVVKPMSESVASFIFNILFGKRKKI